MRRKISWLRHFIRKHQKYAPVTFFVMGFIWDTLTLGRIDRLYDITVLCSYMTALSICLYLFNLADDGKWKGTFIERFEEYLPLAIQFFIGGLSSAYVIYFSRSVSLSKTASFFTILIFLLFANELLKKRISNKYLQFSAYFFVSFTFFAFMIPVLLKEMNTLIFIISGVISLASTIILITYIHYISPSTRKEIHRGRMLGIVAGIYLIINVFYYLNFIPPVPLALKTGMPAHQIEVENGNYFVTYETDEWYIFWRDHRLKYLLKPGNNIYVYSSIFAPTDLKKTVSHQWKWFNPNNEQWEIADNISFEITGGRNGGFRGYTYKNNITDGEWRVDVITEENLLLGVIHFEIVTDSLSQTYRLVESVF